MEWDQTTEEMDLRDKMDRKHKRSIWYGRVFNAIILVFAVLVFAVTVWNFDEVMKWIYGLMGL